jgi:chaperone modulatory protein CbpM
MVMRIEGLTALFADVDAADVRLWVERGWVIPDSAGGDAGEEWEFHEIDVARVRLVRTLRRDMEVGEESMPVVLSLLDQLYDMHAAMRRVLEAIERQPPELQDALRKALSSARRR